MQSNTETKPRALVYDILPSTTAVFSYVIGSRKVSANEQFFVGAQTVVSLLQTTQIKQGVSFIAANEVYTSTNKTTIVWIETGLLFIYFLFLFFYPGVDASHGYVRAWAPGCFHSLISTHTPSIAFRHLPPNSARFGYATEGALFIFRAAVQRRGQRPAKGSGTNMTRSNLAPKHARKHETHPPRVKILKRVPSRFKRLWFYLCWCKLRWQL